MGTTDLVPRLEKAVDGLLYPSETDAPVKVFTWHGDAPFSQQALLESSGNTEKTPIRTTDLDHFFAPVTTPQSWHEEADKERTRRFVALRKLLESELADISVYRFGDINIDVYVVGRAVDGAYRGVTTRVVET